MSSCVWKVWKKLDAFYTWKRRSPGLTSSGIMLDMLIVQTGASVVYAYLNSLHPLSSLPVLPNAPPQVLVFDFGSEVYVWHGKDVPLGDRKVAVKLGKQLYSGSYDYSNCRVNPLDASCTNEDVPK